MKITFAKQYVVLASDLYLGPILGVEQHPICRLDGPDVSSDCDDVTPGQPASDRHRCGDHDACTAAPLTRLVVGRDEDPIMQHSDRQRTLIRAARVLYAALVAH